MVVELNKTDTVERGVIISSPSHANTIGVAVSKYPIQEYLEVIWFSILPRTAASAGSSMRRGTLLDARSLVALGSTAKERAVWRTRAVIFVAADD